MSWIKRNLFFLIGSAVAFLLMGAAGWYLYAQWQVYGEKRENLTKDYAELDGLNKQNPHPGAKEINNDTNAVGQTKEWLALRDQARRRFAAIPPIPEMPKVTDQAFSAALSRTISQLQRGATNASVALATPGYTFSFEAQNSRMSFAAGSLAPLSVQLGEVKAICDVLFAAKINSLDGIKRERVSADDQAANATDYLMEQSRTNEQGILTPYEVTLHCFSQELAAVLADFASSPYGFFVKTINVEPGPAVAATTDTGAAPTVAQAFQPPPPPMPVPIRRSESDNRAAFNSRYGIGGPGERRRVPQIQQPTVYAPQPVAAPVRTGPSIVLDERQLKVVMVVELVKLVEEKQAEKQAAPK